MAKIKITYLSLIAIAVSAPVYAQDYNSYQAVEARAEADNARIGESINMQNIQNQMNHIQQQAPVYQQPQVQYQPVTRDTMYGTMYVGPGSGYGR